MNIDDFLKKHIEEYLFQDLESMARIQLPTGQRHGACGYPMLGAISSGMEMLGVLLSEHFSIKDGGEGYFKKYWRKCLARAHTPYREPFLDEAFRQLIRNGIDHTFVAKPGIIVTKNQPKTHLGRTGEGALIVDASQLFEDFKDSYEDRFKPILTNNRDLMQGRLDDMIRQYSEQADNLLKILQRKPEICVPGDAPEGSDPVVPSGIDLPPNTILYNASTSSQSIGGGTVTISRPILPDNKGKT